MNYQTFEPSKELTTLIKCYWTLESPKEETPEKQNIVPDGCMEMIFHYGDLYKQYLENGNSIIQPKCFVIGQLTRPLEIEPIGETGIFSVRFHPNGFFPFATFSIKEMENTAFSLEKLFGKDGQEIEQKILNANSTSDRIKQIETFLINRLTDIETVDLIVKSTVETILTANGQLSVDELSKQSNINRRQLERNYPLDDVLYRYQYHVLPAYEKHILPYMEEADIVINNNHHFRNGLNVLEGFIRDRLRRPVQ